MDNHRVSNYTTGMLKYYIKIYGCLFNYADAERIDTVLRNAGFTRTLDYTLADVIIIVTCSVREKAEHKVLAWGQRITKLTSKPKVVLTGCMVRRDHLPESAEDTLRWLKVLKRRMPWVDVFVDITNIGDLPSILTSQVDAFEFALKRQDPAYLDTPPTYSSDIFAYIPIMTGCNQFCTYCVVPYSRGREVYRPSEQILKEVRDAIASGKKVITLLGQIVDKWREDGKDFTWLLETVASLEGDFWVTFTSPYPTYITHKTIDLIAEHPKILKHLGLPLQSGSDRILAKMNRGYTVKEYIQIAEYARATIPNLYLTTDIIVGFPSETESDFQKTLEVVKKLEFDKIFFAKYSPRHKQSRDIIHDISYQKEVNSRFERLNRLAQEIFLKRNQRLVGREFPAIYLGDAQALSFRNQLVDLKQTSLPKQGSFIKVKIIDAGRRGLVGKTVGRE